MGDVLGRPDLVQELPELFRVVLRILGQELEGHGLLELLVVGAEDLALGAGAETDLDLVASGEDVTGLEADVVAGHAGKLRRSSGPCHEGRPVF